MNYLLTAIYLYIINYRFCESQSFHQNDLPLETKSESQLQETILPYSLYNKRRLEAEQRRNALLQSNATLWSKAPKSEANNAETIRNSNSQQPALDQDSNQPIKIYLPAYQATQLSSMEPLFSNQKSSKSDVKSYTSLATSKPEWINKEQPDNERRNYPQLPENELYSSASKGTQTYTTGVIREPIHKSVPQSRNKLPRKSLNGMPEPNEYGQTSAENSLITRPTSMFQPATSTLSAAAAAQRRYNRLGVPMNALQNGVTSANKYQPTFSRIVPAPYSSLSVAQPGSQTSNIVDDIFSQSQVRHAPQSLAPGFSGIAPLSGSPFGAPIMPQFGGGGGAVGAGAANPGQALLNGLGAINPLELLGQGSTLDQISKIAKNLLQMSNGGGGGNSELFSAVSKVIGAGPVDAGSKLTSNAVLHPEPPTIIKAAVDDGNSTSLNVSQVQALFLSNNTQKLLPALIQESLTTPSSSLLPNLEKGISSSTVDSLTLINTLPSDERALLEAAIKNGELNGTNFPPELNAILEQQTNKKPSLIRSENKLMEWIQQNRPRSSEKEALNNVAIQAADKLPYYGRYCGSFDINTNNRYNVAGAVWVVDEHRLIVTKFNFQPGLLGNFILFIKIVFIENITFWVGPEKVTARPEQDVFPSENGFYVRPENLNIQAFMIQSVEVRDAKIRPRILALVNDSPVASNRTAEADEESDIEDNVTASKNLLNNQIRMKRNLYEDLYENNLNKNTVSFPIHFQTPNSTGLHFTVNPTHPTLGTLNSTTTSIFSTLTTTPPSTSIFTTPLVTNPTTGLSFGTFGSPITPITTVMTTSHTSNDISKNYDSLVGNTKAIVPLEWHAGYQPVLLDLGDDRFVKNLNWISLFDHNKKQTVAYTLIPNGIGFKIPSIVQLRPFTANNKAYNVFAGAIKILDTKTIEINDFSLISKGMPLWFMVGKEVVPNGNGQIVPVASKTFDCDSLRDYHNETVTLKLPANLDIKEVFWFAVFSIPKSISYAHMYIPYSEIQLPPSLSVDVKDSQIGKVWLAGPTTMVVGLVLCGKVIIDWGPAMLHGREGTIDSLDQLTLPTPLPASNFLSNGLDGKQLKVPLVYENEISACSSPNPSYNENLLSKKFNYDSADRQQLPTNYSEAPDAKMTRAISSTLNVPNSIPVANQNFRHSIAVFDSNSRRNTTFLTNIDNEYSNLNSLQKKTKQELNCILYGNPELNDDYVIKSSNKPYNYLSTNIPNQMNALTQNQTFQPNKANGPASKLNTSTQTPLNLLTTNSQQFFGTNLSTGCECAELLAAARQCPTINDILQNQNFYGNNLNRMHNYGSIQLAQPLISINQLNQQIKSNVKRNSSFCYQGETFVINDKSFFI